MTAESEIYFPSSLETIILFYRIVFVQTQVSLSDITDQINARSGPGRRILLRRKRVTGTKQGWSAELRWVYKCTSKQNKGKLGKGNQMVAKD